MQDHIEAAEDLGYGMIRKRYNEGQIVAYINQARKSTRGSADAWANAVLSDMRAWDASRPYLVLHDFRQLGLTPYNRHRSLYVISQYPPHLFGRYAIVLSRGVLGVGIRLFASTRLPRLVPNLSGEFMFDYDKALEWLRAGLTMTKEDHKK